MGQVIWVNALVADKVEGDPSDKPMILTFAKELDRLCIGSRKYSDFIDYTDIKANLTGDLQGYTDGWELLKEKGKWFTPEIRTASRQPTICPGSFVLPVVAGERERAGSPVEWFL